MGEIAARGLFVLAGGLLVLSVLYDLMVSVVVPRPAPNEWRVSGLFFRSTWRAWTWISARRSLERREALLGSYAPLAVIAVLVAWVALLAVGYGLVLWALREQIRPVPQSLGSALYLSAVSLLTIGFGDIVPEGAAARLTVIAEAGTGLGTVALVIAMLFSLYASFQRREALVITLDAAAGAPPSGIGLLESARRWDMPELLPQTMGEWRTWAAEVLESHLAYPMLIYFRSSHDNESWISSLGAVMDAATLLITTVEGVPQGPARLMYKVGVHLVEDLSHTTRLPHDHVVGVERFEFDEARGRLEAAGYSLRPADPAWEEFGHLRSEYAAPLNELARRLEIPPAQWIGDRSYMPHRV